MLLCMGCPLFGHHNEYVIGINIIYYFGALTNLNLKVVQLWDVAKQEEEGEG